MCSTSTRSTNRKKRKIHSQQVENYIFSLPNIEEEVEIPVSVDSASDLSLPVFMARQKSSSESTSISSTSEIRDFDEYVNPGKSEFCEAILSTILSCPGVTLSASETIVNLINAFISRFSKDQILLPNIRYFWDKRAKTSTIAVYIICEKNHSHGPFFGEVKNFGTYVCEGKIFQAQLKPDRYFLHILFKPQLEIHLPLLPASCFQENHQNPDDICNSSAAKRVKISNSDSNIKRYTLTLHADEVTAGNSSNVSIFPIFMTVNEMAKKFRKENFFLIGLFVGRKKPPVEIYLGPIIQELRILSESPITWKAGNSEEVKATFHLIAAIADAPMRSYLRNVRQFNHLNGCDWCLVRAGSHQGARVYPVLQYNELSDLKRTKEDFLNFEEFLKSQDDIQFDTNRFLGLVGCSPLLKLADFDIVNGFAVEPMHCIVLGIFRNMIFKGWLGSENIGIMETGVDRNLFKTELGNRLKSILVPSEFPRIPRDLSQLKYWKSSEYDSMLCYYLFPCIKGLLRPRFINNILCLAKIYSILNQPNVADDFLVQIKNLVIEFQTGVQQLYGKNQLTYNLHILSHLSDSVSFIGPFANISAYPCENQMGILKDKVRRSSNIAQNLVRVFMNDFKHRELVETKVKKWKLPGNIMKNFGISSCESGQAIITAVKLDNPDDDIKNLVSSLLVDSFGIYIVGRLQDINYHNSISYNSIRYSTQAYSNDKTRNDSIVKTKEGIFLQIKCIAELNSQFFLIGSKFKSQKLNVKFKGFTGEFSLDLEHIHIIKGIENEKIIKVQEVERKGILIKSADFHPKYHNNFLVESFLHNT